MIKELSIIIPVFNEEKNIAEVLQKIFSLQLIDGIEKQIVIVDDCSSDDSVTQIEKIIPANRRDVVFIKQKMNGGKGSAIRAGLGSVTGDYVIIQDADLELNPEDINKLLKIAITHCAEVVYGSRFLTPQLHPIPAKTRLANYFLSFITSLLTTKKITDMETCYKLIKSEFILHLKLKEERFGFEPEITMKLLRKKNIKFREASIYYKARNVNDGKKIGIKDGFRALYCLIKYRFDD